MADLTSRTPTGQRKEPPVPEINHEQTLNGLRDHLNRHMWAGIADEGVFVNADPDDDWTDYEVDLLVQVLASAPQRVRSGLAAVLAVPHLVYPHIEEAADG